MDINDEKIETLTPFEASKYIPKNAEFLRAGLRQNRFPFGTATQGKTGQWNYLIIKKKYFEFLGIEEKKDG